METTTQHQPVAAASLDRPAPRPPEHAGDPSQELWAEHLGFAELAAQLDLDDTVAYHFAEPLIREAADEAYLTAAAITGTVPLAPTRAASPVMRLRELASAQAVLARALEERRAQPQVRPTTSEAVRTSLIAVASLRRGLETLLGSTRASTTMPTRHRLERGDR